MNHVDEFYIGWQSQAPAAVASHVRKVVVALAILLLVVAGVVASAQRTIGGAVFEWGTVKNFNGVLRTRPYPHLLVQRPGRGGGWSAYYLVAPFKHGVDTGKLAALDSKAVTVKGTLIYRGGATMIEVRPESIQPLNATTEALEPSQVTNLGRQTLVGEIVDSKCYLGVMNPGRWTPHRACAVRCISGGIPPILVVRPADGPPRHFLLVSSDGRPVNRQVLDMVAEPVEISGEVVRQGELSILRADPTMYRRVRK